MAANAPSSSIYISNIQQSISESELVNLLQTVYGATITWKKFYPATYHSGKAAALIQVESVERATEIITTLNDILPEGLTEPFQISYANRSAPQQGGGVQGGGCHGCGPQGGSNGDSGTSLEANLYMQNLPPNTDEGVLHELFKDYGQITSCRVLPSGTAALVRFATPAEAKHVMFEMAGQQLPGAFAPLIVRVADNKSSSSKGHPMNSLPQSRPSPYDIKGGGGFAGAGYNMKGGTGFVSAGNDIKGGGGFASACGSTTPFAGKGGKGGGLTHSGLVKMLVDQNVLSDGSNSGNDFFPVYVAGLPLDADDGNLYKMFAPFGAIYSSCISKKVAHGKDYVIAFVNFAFEEAANNAIAAYNGMQLPDGSYMKLALKPGKR